MANPLTLYVPIKQDPITQAAAVAAQEGFVPLVKQGLDASKIVHYARLALVPNSTGSGYAGILLVTTFDGPMNPYLKFFWDTGGLQQAIAGLANLALNPPDPPITDLTSFENFINSNNLNEAGDMYQVYPQTVKQILAKFPPK